MRNDACPEVHHGREAQIAVRSAVPASQLDETYCPICAGKQRRFLLAEREYPIWQCRHCSHIYVSPHPCDAWLSNYYRKGYLPQTDSETLYEAPGQRVYDLAARAITRFHPQRGDLLDVGAGFGGLLTSAGAFQWKLHGVEPSEAAFAVAQRRLGGKAALRLGTFRRADFAPCSFDCIVMLNIVEHVRDPLKTCREAFELLRPGGCLALRCPPRVTFLLRRRRLSRACGIRPFFGAPAHLHEYTGESMNLLMRTAGFERIRYFWPGIKERSIKDSFIRCAVIGAANHLGPLLHLCTFQRMPAPFVPKLALARKPRESS